MKNSRTKSTALATLVAASLAALSGGMVGTANGGKAPADTPVTSILDTTGDIASGTNFRIQGDEANSQPYFNGVSSVSSIIQGATPDWVLDTTGSTTRTVLIDLRNPVPGSGAQQIFAYESLPVRIIVKCDRALSGSFPAMALNQTLSCPTGIGFDYAGEQYGLMMTSGPNSENYEETNNPQVTCTAVSSTTKECIAWTITPITQASGTVENVARLRKPKGNSFVDLGDFYVTFLWNVTNP